MSTPFKPLEIPPGVVAMPTKQQRSSNWAQVNLMRWVEGQMTPVGGQSQYGYNFASRCRRVHSWYDLDNNHYIAYLCESNLYVDLEGELFDITPTGGIAPPQLSTVGGYGDGLYGVDDYGTPRALSTIQLLYDIPAVYSLQNFGAILLAMTSADGRLIQWDPSLGAPGPANLATPVVADTGRGPVPVGRLFVVTQERFCMVFGAFDATNGGGPRRFAWSDQENYRAWDYANIISQAGYLDIEPASPIVAAHTTTFGVLMWTATTTYINAFLGLPYIYNYTEIAKNCTPWSPQSVASVVSMTLWFSEQGLYSYNGAWAAPMPCKVRTWIDNDIDPLNVRWQAVAVHVAPFNEFWWFYPQSTAPNGYNTRCVIYNYKEGWWSMGQMSRSAGITAAYTVPVVMADGLNAYEHEVGTTYPANVPLPWAETFDLNLNSGSRLTTIKQMIPDVTGDVTNLLYSLFYKNSRSVMPDPVTGAPILVQEQQTIPRTVNTSNGFLDLRTTGRDMRMRIALAGPQVLPVTVGQHLVDAVPRGDR